jgi:hypothetical protein
MAERSADVARTDQTTKRALAIVLMQEVIPLLDTLGETIAAGHLQIAIDIVAGDASSPRSGGSC